MLKKLSIEQEAQFAKYAEKWINLGLACGNPLPPQPELERLFAAVYEVQGLPTPTVETVLSPSAGCQRAAQLFHGRTKVTKEEISAQRNRCGYGLHDAGWLSFYMFFLAECPEVKGPERLRPLMELAKAGVGWWWPFETHVVVSPQPAKLFLANKATGPRLLHNPNGMALEYPDGTGVYALNGVRFTGPDTVWITTPTDQLDPNKILSIKNVEQRTEVLKKYGLAKLFDKLSPSLLDSGTYSSLEYKLWKVNLNGNDRIYLQMPNPSVDEIHIEAVAPECTTVTQALSWRNFGEPSKKFIVPSILT